MFMIMVIRKKSIIIFLLISQIIVILIFMKYQKKHSVSKVEVKANSAPNVKVEDHTSSFPEQITYNDENGKKVTVNVTYNEPNRAQIHYSPPVLWMNDPCGLVYYEGEYHLFYEYNPTGMVETHLSWGHAVSTDLFHWKTLPVAIMHDYPWNELYSGSTVIDHRNTTGFGTNAMVVMYTNFNRTPTELQHQHLAISLDKGRTFKHYQHNPVIGTIVRNIRDPGVFWYEPLSEWRMVITDPLHYKMMIYGSRNMKDWSYLSHFAGRGTNVWMWETPDMFELPVKGKDGESKWVVVIGIKNHEKGLDDWSSSYSTHGYFLGHFDGYNFISDYPDSEIRYLDYGHDFFAGQTFRNAPNGRRILMAWMNSWLYCKKWGAQPWSGEITLPRELTLVHNHCHNGRLELRQEPVPEIQNLRIKSWKFNSKLLPKLFEEIKQIRGRTLDIEVSIIIKDPRDWFNILVHSSEDYENHTVIGYNNTNERVFMDVSKSGTLIDEQFTKVKREAIISPCKERIDLRIIIDWTSVEVFVNYGSLSITTKILPKPNFDHIGIDGRDSIIVEYFKVHTLKSVWH